MHNAFFTLILINIDVLRALKTSPYFSEPRNAKEHESEKRQSNINLNLTPQTQSQTALIGSSINPFNSLIRCTKGMVGKLPLSDMSYED
jgi:hypothetical protein